MFRLRIFLVFLLSPCSGLFAQDQGYWPTPEVEQMHRQAREYLSRGAVNQAVVLFQQAIQLAPEVMILHRDLGQALNLIKNYELAYSTVEPIIRNDQADELTYQIAAVALVGQRENKKARNILNKGIKAFPNSGILYNQLGKVHEANKDAEYALDAWLQGIQVDPFYHLNYYEAARMHLNTNRPVWTIIYGEIFANLERHTPRSLEMRKIMLEAYGKVFRTVGTSSVPKYGHAITAGEDPGFEAAVRHVFAQLAPVVSDGITTENLIMLRARFAMDWRTEFAERFPFTLFSYHERLLRDGEFDAYNQWLFGQAENPKQYESWTKFHTESMPAFEQWVSANQYKPAAADFYHPRELRSLFSGRKKG